MTARTLTVVFTDIKGFTERTSRSSRAQMVKVLEKHEELLKPIILQHGGRVVKTIGDAFLLTFESPTNAVLCGVRMQARLAQHNAEVPPEDHIDIRISMNTGEVEVIGNDVFGETVNLASRVEGITDAGEVYFTESTYLVMNKAEVPTSQVGQFRFKGIPEQVTIYRVVQDEKLDLYNQVIHSQAVAEPVPPDAGEVPEGALSTGLLYSLEQQKALEARRRVDPIIGAVVTVGLLVLVGLAWFAYDAYRFGAQRNDAAQLVTAGHIKPALDLLAALREEKPADPELLGLLERAVAADVAALAAGHRYEEAFRRIEEHRARYPDLPGLDALTRSTRLGEAEWVARNNLDRARQLLEALHKAHPDDGEIALRLARLTAEHFDSRRAMFLLGQVLQRDPQRVLGEAWTAEAVRRYLGGVYRDGATLALIDQHFYAALKPWLLERIGDPQDKEVRRNAYALLSRHGDLTPLDEFRFFTAELFYRTISERVFRAETFAYFEGLLAKGVPAVIQGALPIDLPPARVLNRTSPDRKRALPIIKKLFPQALRN